MRILFVARSCSRQPNLLRVFEIILGVSEEDEKEFIESNSVMLTKMEFLFSKSKPLAASSLSRSFYFMLTTKVVCFIYSKIYWRKFSSLLVASLILIIFVMFTWWRDIIREATFVVLARFLLTLFFSFLK